MAKSNLTSAIEKLTSPETPAFIRRLVTIPLLWLSTLLIAKTLLLLLSATLVFDLVRRRFELPTTRVLLAILVFIVGEWSGVALGAASFLASIALRLGADEGQRIDIEIQRRWSQALWAAFSFLIGFEVKVEGELEPTNNQFILWVRHTSLLDVFVSANVIANPNRRFLGYVLKDSILMSPAIDIFGSRLPNAFVRRGVNRDKALAKIRDMANRLPDNGGALIYPEGTRFSERKRQRAVEKIQEHGEPTLAQKASLFINVLPPKTEGSKILFETLPDADLVVLNHYGFEGGLHLIDILKGGLFGKTLNIRVTHHSHESLPQPLDDDALFDLWLREDEWLTENNIE